MVLTECHRLYPQQSDYIFILCICLNIAEYSILFLVSLATYSVFTQVFKRRGLIAFLFLAEVPDYIKTAVTNWTEEAKADPKLTIQQALHHVINQIKY